MRKSSIDKSTIILLISAFVLGVLIIILVVWNNKLLNQDSKGNNYNQSEKRNNIKKIDITEIVNKIKTEHSNILYESDNNVFKSIVYSEESSFNSIIIDLATGEELTFLDMLTDEDAFRSKELELLKLKYPEFIISGILNSTGVKSYYVKDKEVIIYYTGYTYNYNIENEITLKIDFNEIKDILKYKVDLNETYENEDGFKYDSTKKSVAITFDDGPSRSNNGKILDILAKNKAHATFFMLGNMMASCNNCVLETYKSGNEIGSHTYNHLNMKKNSLNDINESLAKTNNIYNSITGANIKLVRPPYGAYSNENLLNASNPYILWNLDTEDWRYRNVEHIVNYVKENICDGGIILMHELYTTSVEALEIILPWAYANGYQAVSVSELAKLKGHFLEAGQAYRSFR